MLTPLSFYYLIFNYLNIFISFSSALEFSKRLVLSGDFIGVSQSELPT